MSQSYWQVLVGTNLRSMSARRRQFLLTSLILIVQNALFFGMWVIFFAAVPNVRGWGLPEIEIFQGIVNAGLGVALFFGDGVWHLDRQIVEGSIDLHLVRPRHPLPMLVFGEAYGFTGPGHVTFGLFLFALARLTLYGWMLAVLSSILIGALLAAVCLLFKTLAFFMRESGSLPDQLMNTVVALAIVPQHTESAVMKLLLFSILPAGFMVILPVELVRSGALSLLLWLACATAGYTLLAIAAFNLGLRRYTSATGWKV